VSNVPNGDWKAIDSNVLAELQRRSSVRVAGNEEFREINEKLAKRAQEDDVIHLAEFIKEREEEEAEAAEKNGTTDAAKPATGKSGETAGAKPAPQKTAPAGPGAAGADKKTAAKEEEKPEPTPQREEALRILADLVDLQHTDPATWHAQQSAPSSASLSSPR
jgi:hypothetical protein